MARFHNASVPVAGLLLGVCGAATPAHADWTADGEQLHTGPVQAEAPLMPSEPAPTKAPTLRPLHFTDKPFGIQLRTGYSTTVGELGLVAEYDLLDEINVGIGVGTNILGVMPGAHLRLRPILFPRASGQTTHAIIIEVGGSVGRYEGALSDNLGLGDSEFRYSTPVRQTVFWGQAEVGWEMREASGLAMRASCGAAMTIPEPTWQWKPCVSDGYGTCAGNGTTPSRVIEVLTYSIGYVF